MKEKLVVIVAILVLCFMGGIYFFHTNKDAATVEEAIKQSGRHADIMLYQEKVKNGVLVFFKSDVGNNEYALNAGFVKKSLFGWKWVWGGSTGENEQYFPSVKGTPFPLLFGEIIDNAIKQVIISDKEHSYAKTADIEGSGNDRIWFVFPDESGGPDFDIVWQSNEGEVFNLESVNVMETSCYATQSDTN